MSSQQLIVDTFESLFQTYGKTQSLPKFKKKKISKTRASDCAETSSSVPHKAVLNTSNTYHHDQSSILGRAVSHQGTSSLSSGVFSLDSDPECLPPEDDLGPVNAPEGVDDPESVDEVEPLADPEELAVAEECGFGHLTPTDDDVVSKAGSGITHRYEPGHSGDGQLMVKELQPRPANSLDNPAISETGLPSHILTDEDVLFLMHKPRLKKRKKKPPWQKRKLDLDDLWLKGQHRWCTSRTDEDEEMPNKLYLERNLRWGKISLDKYAGALKTSRKGRGRVKRKESCQSKRTNSTSGKKDGGKKGPFKAAQHVALRNDSNVSEKGGGQSSKLKRNRKNPESSKVKKQLIDVSSEESSVQECVITTSRRTRGMPRVMSTVMSSTDSVTIPTRRSRVTSSLMSSTDSGGGDTAQNSANTSHATRMSHIGSSRLDDQHEACLEPSSESDSSIINFVSLTPKKSRKKLQKRRNRQQIVSRNNMPSVKESSYNRNRRMLMVQATSQTSDGSEWDDVEANYKPLFSQSRHCGGVWGSIVDESTE